MFYYLYLKITDKIVFNLCKVKFSYIFALCMRRVGNQIGYRWLAYLKWINVKINCLQQIIIVIYRNIWVLGISELFFSRKHKTIV